MLKTVTGREIRDAIIADGFGKIRQAWFTVNDTGVEACLLGAAAINLNVLADTSGMEVSEADQLIPADYDLWYNNKYSLYEQLNNILTKDGKPVGSDIISFYDANTSVEEQVEMDMSKWAEENWQSGYAFDTPEEADAFEEDYQGRWEEEEKTRTQYWQNVMANKDPVPDEIGAYYLNTWDEAIEHVKEVLEPFLDTEFTLAVLDYNQGLADNGVEFRV